MQKNIPVPFRINQQEVVIDVSYNIDMSDNIQTITCSVTRNEHNAWLELFRFGYRSRKQGSTYTQLFYDNSNVKNIQTAIFIDKAYAAIMKKEKCELEVL